MEPEWKNALVAEAQEVGVTLDAVMADRLSSHVDLLLRWNAKVNLTRIVRHEEVRVKHVIDSLGALPLLPPGPRTVLDMGAGAGFPGIPFLCMRPELQVTLVDTVGKKVGFLKSALAQLKLGGRAVQTRLGGHPVEEGLTPVQVVVSRAFMELGEVLVLARPYLTPDGCVLAMLGPREDAVEAKKRAEAMGFVVEDERAFSLPHQMGQRRVIRVVPRGTPA
jgi:16S rRNA (guanine527-N7)-methyltransferase